jgi:hypothetical protein
MKPIIREAHPVRAMTVWQPWADALAYLGKDIENRRRATTYRGTLYIHAGLRTDPVAYAQLLGREDLPGVTGAIIAVARLTGAHHGCGGSCSAWAEPGAWHWHIRDAVALRTPVKVTGRQGLWIPDAQLRAQVTAATPSLRRANGGRRRAP